MIEVGDFVRTKQGKIAKLIEVSKNNYYWFDNWIYKESGIPHQGFRIEDTERIGIVKHSKNIIDLLEEGDYVNLERILDITEEYIRTTETIHNKSWLAKNITSILTHELYKANAYKVKGE